MKPSRPKAGILGTEKLTQGNRENVSRLKL
jgi:hypothetical protein